MRAIKDLLGAMVARGTIAGFTVDHATMRIEVEHNDGEIASFTAEEILAGLDSFVGALR